MIIYNSFCHLTSPKFIPTWSDSQAVIDRILMLFLSFQSPHNGDDLSEGEGDVGSPDDEMAQKVRNILFVIPVCVVWIIYSNWNNKYWIQECWGDMLGIIQLGSHWISFIQSNMGTGWGQASFVKTYFRFDHSHNDSQQFGDIPLYLETPAGCRFNL